MDSCPSLKEVLPGRCKVNENAYNFTNVSLTVQLNFTHGCEAPEGSYRPPISKYIGPRFIKKMLSYLILPVWATPILKERQPVERLLFNMGLPIPVRQCHWNRACLSPTWMNPDLRKIQSTATRSVWVQYTRWYPPLTPISKPQFSSPA